MNQVFLPYTFLESEMIMKNLTVPQAILFGLGLIALAIASVPYSSKIVKPAFASNGVHKIAICSESGTTCTKIFNNGALRIRN